MNSSIQAKAIRTKRHSFVSKTLGRGIIKLQNNIFTFTDENGSEMTLNTSDIAYVTSSVFRSPLTIVPKDEAQDKLFFWISGSKSHDEDDFDFNARHWKLAFQNAGVKIKKAWL